MSRRDAEELDAALHDAAAGGAPEGRMAALVQTTHRVGVLAQTVPPPGGLAAGRQRFLAEAVRLRAAKADRRRLPARPRGVWQTATALAAVALLLGLAWGATRAAADSLPGGALYDLKLAAEKVRLALTSDEADRAEVEWVLAQKRLDEIVAMLRQGREVGAQDTGRAVSQLEAALGAAAWLGAGEDEQALQRLAEGIEQRQRTMLAAAGEKPQPPVRELVREMERVRQEVQAGQGDPDGLRQRLRQGTQALPGATPRSSGTAQPSRTPRASSTAQPSYTPSEKPTGSPPSTQPPRATLQPTQSQRQTPAPSLTATPQSTAGLEPTGRPTDFPGGGGPGVTPEPSGEPRQTSRPDATGEPGQGSGSGEGGGGPRNP